jgi:hypothetical protein
MHDIFKVLKGKTLSFKFLNPERRGKRKEEIKIF